MLNGRVRRACVVCEAASAEDRSVGRVCVCVGRESAGAEDGVGGEFNRLRGWAGVEALSPKQQLGGGAGNSGVRQTTCRFELATFHWLEHRRR